MELKVTELWFYFGLLVKTKNGEKKLNKYNYNYK